MLWYLPTMKILSALGILNFLILQWLGIRLGRCTDEWERPDGERVRRQSWALLGFVLPMTGWSSDYVWLWRRRGSARLVQLTSWQ